MTRNMQSHIAESRRMGTVYLLLGPIFPKPLHPACLWEVLLVLSYEMWFGLIAGMNYSGTFLF